MFPRKSGAELAIKRLLCINFYFVFGIYTILICGIHFDYFIMTTLVTSQTEIIFYANIIIGVKHRIVLYQIIAQNIENRLR